VEATLTAQVFDFPHPALPGARAQAAAASASPASARLSGFRPRRFYRFADLVRMLALDDPAVTIRTQIEYLRRMHLQSGMPLPVNPRWWAGRLQHGAAMIGQRSKWCALEIDAWAEGERTPPGAPPSAAGAAPPFPPLARQDMAARAQLLAGAGR
jgi:hypothetical protein